MANVVHQAVDLVDSRQIIVDVGVQQAASNVHVQLIEVLSEIAAFFEVEGVLQAQNNTAGASERLALLGDVFVLDVAFGRRQALKEAIKEHLDQLHAIGA